MTRPGKETATSCEGEGRRNRRQLLALGGAAAAAATVAALRLDDGKKAHAASGDPLIIGQDNTAGNPTRLDASIVPPDPDDPNSWVESFQVQNLSGHPRTVAVAGVSHGGHGVVGAADGEGAVGVGGKSDIGVGVMGDSPSGTGVLGHSESGNGVFGRSESDVGVQGRSQTGFGVMGVAEGVSEGWGPVGVIGAAVGAGAIGVHGKSDRGCGVNGRSEYGPGVVGEGLGDGPGVRAESRSRTEPYPLDGGLALEVQGKARFSTCGAYTLPRGQNSVFVPNAAVTDVSHITVTLTGDPGPRQLHWVERDPGVGFRLHLTQGPPPQRPQTAFTYLIVEPG